MAKIQHKVLSQNDVADGKGIHVQLSYPDAADEAARLAIVQSASDRGRMIWQLSDASVWMANGAGGWKQMCGGGGGGTGLDDFTSDSTTSTSGAVTSVIGSYTTVADDSVATMRAVVWAQDDTSNDAQKYVIEVTIKRDNSSVVTVEAVDVLSQFEDQAPATDAVTFIVNGLDIDVTVLGIAGRGIEWRAQLYVSSIEV